jgi:probable F420-dependent oxidoreductase
VQVGIFYMPTAYTADVVPLARRVEDLGFESLWVPDHPIMPVKRTSPFPGGGEMPDSYAHLMDPLVTLAAAAGATERIRLGTGIVLAAEREPLVLAKEVATLDLVSNGRFEFGIGAGWQREEAETLGVHWKRRWAHVREHVLAMKACWADGVAEFHGEYVDFPPVWSDPKPVQRPHPPILIAGELARAPGRIAEYGDGWIPRFLRVTPEEVAATRRRIESLYREAGRDFSTFRVTMFGSHPDRETHRRLEDAGVDRVLQVLRVSPEEDALARVETWAERLLAA